MVTLILFIILLGSIIFIHEGGHFLFAKLTGIYVYEIIDYVFIPFSELINAIIYFLFLHNLILRQY